MNRRHALALPLLVAAMGLPAPSAYAGGGCGDPITEAPTTTVRITHACFGPTIAKVPVGATVRWENRSGLQHNLSGTEGWYVDNFADGTGHSVRFTVAGLYPYACTIHPGMVGLVAVGNVAGAPVRNGGAVDLGSSSLQGVALAPVATQPVAQPAAQPVTKPIATTTEHHSNALAWVFGGLLVLLAAGLAIGLGNRSLA